MKSHQYFTPKGNHLILVIMALIFGVLFLFGLNYSYNEIANPLNKTLIGNRGPLDYSDILFLVFFNLLFALPFFLFLFGIYVSRKTKSTPFMTMDASGIHIRSLSNTQSFPWREVRLAEISGDELYIYMKPHTPFDPPRTIRIETIHFDDPHEVVSEIMRFVGNSK